jgi:hypothetical protein
MTENDMEKLAKAIKDAGKPEGMKLSEVIFKFVSRPK